MPGTVPSDQNKQSGRFCCGRRLDLQPRNASRGWSVGINTAAAEGRQQPGPLSAAPHRTADDQASAYQQCRPSL